MAEIVKQRPDSDGEQVTFAAASAGGDHVVSGTGSADVLLLVENTDVSAHTVTVDDPNSSGPAGATAFDPDVAVAVPAGATVAVRLNPARFADADGEIAITYSAATGMQVAALTV